MSRLHSSTDRDERSVGPSAFVMKHEDCGVQCADNMEFLLVDHSASLKYAAGDHSLVSQGEPTSRFVSHGPRRIAATDAARKREMR